MKPKHVERAKTPDDFIDISPEKFKLICILEWLFVAGLGSGSIVLLFVSIAGIN